MPERTLLTCLKCGANFSSEGVYREHVLKCTGRPASAISSSVSVNALQAALAGSPLVPSPVLPGEREARMKSLKADAMTVGVQHIDKFDTLEALEAAIVAAKEAKAAAAVAAPVPSQEELAAKAKAEEELESRMKSLRGQAMKLKIKALNEFKSPEELEAAIAAAKDAKKNGGNEE